MKRFMNKMNEKKGFTLAELLIVVAIIAVLVAVAIPVFTAQLNKSKYATDVANARSVYAQLTADLLANGSVTLPTGVSSGSKSTLTYGGNTFQFSGLSSVTFAGGTDSETPIVVTVTPSNTSYGEAATFGTATP